MNKKFIFVSFIILAIIGIVVFLAIKSGKNANTVEFKLGDLNSDGTVDTFDADFILEYGAAQGVGLLATEESRKSFFEKLEISYLTEEQTLTVGDITGDGRVAADDAATILMYLVNKNIKEEDYTIEQYIQDNQ